MHPIFFNKLEKSFSYGFHGRQKVLKSISLEVKKGMEKSSLVRLGLEALIARESSKRLARIGGTEKELRSIPRRRAGQQ